MIYLDANVIVSSLLPDAHSERARAWLDGLSDSLVISDLAALEAGAVISRNYRSGDIRKHQADGALLDLDAIRAHAHRMRHEEADFALAERLVRDYSTKLAGPDALHLASAMNARATLATFDARLAAAARGRGVEVAEMG